MDRQLWTWKLCFLIGDEAFSALLRLLAGNPSYQHSSSDLGETATQIWQGQYIDAQALGMNDRPYPVAVKDAGAIHATSLSIQHDATSTDSESGPNEVYDVPLLDWSPPSGEMVYAQWTQQMIPQAYNIENPKCQVFDIQLPPLEASLPNLDTSNHGAFLPIDSTPKPKCDAQLSYHDKHVPPTTSPFTNLIPLQDSTLSGTTRKRNHRTRPCARCWMDKRKCHKKFEVCSNCMIGNIPSQLCFPARFANAAVFRKWKNPTYSSKLTWGNLSWTQTSHSVRLQHYIGGPTIQLDVSAFRASSPDETNVYWKYTSGWRTVATTPFGLPNPMLDLSAYIGQHIQVLTESTREDPIQRLLAASDRTDELFTLAIELWTATHLLMKGWSIAGRDTLGISVIEDFRCPLNGTIPAPRVLQNQLDHNLEYYIMAREEALLKKIQNTFLKRGIGSNWEGMCAALIVMLRVLERDTWRLAYWRHHGEEVEWSSFRYFTLLTAGKSYKWRHPSTPETLMDANLHLARLLLAHFGVAGNFPKHLQLILETSANRSAPKYKADDESSLDGHLISLLLTPSKPPNAEW